MIPFPFQTGGLGFARVTGASGGVANYLDELATPPDAVWSLDKRISTATNAIRVRRSSDNAEQDIGFTGNALDTTSLATFVGANSAFIVTVYDQTGGGADLEMAAAASQPRIVNAGSYQDNWSFDGSNDYLASAISLAMGTPRVWVFAEWEQATDSNVKVLVELSADYGAATDRFIVYDYSIQGGMVASMGQAGSTRAEYFNNAAGMGQWSVVLDRSLTGDAEVKAYRAGTELTGTAVGGSSTEQTGNFGSHALHVGARSGGTLLSTATMRQLAIYSADVSALRSSIETILNS